MSRIGKQPIPIPDAVNVAIDPGRVTVNGPLGELTQNVPARISIEKEDGQLVVKRPTERGDDRALHGLTRSLVANMVEGVTNGFEKRLEIQGVGYRAALRGTALELNVGYSHQVVIDPPAGITFEVPVQTEIVVKGIDKQQVGEIAAEIRDVAHPSRTRARASATRASTCAGRSESERNGYVDRQQARIRRHRRVRKNLSGTAERPGSSCSARTGDRGPARRRPLGQDARRSQLAAPEEVVQGRQEGAGGRGRQAACGRGQEGRDRGRRVRSRRLPVPRAREGARRRSP